MSSTPTTIVPLIAEQVAIMFAVRDGGIMMTSQSLVQDLVDNGFLEARILIRSTEMVQSIGLTEAGRAALVPYEAGQ
jgi:hypothetical protein